MYITRNNLTGELSVYPDDITFVPRETIGSDKLEWIYF